MNNKERFTMLAHIAELETERDRLREALNDLMMAAESYQIAICDATGMGYPWPALDIALDNTRAALQEDSDA